VIRTEDRDGVRVLTLARAPVNAVDLTFVQGSAARSPRRRPTPPAARSW
jgi:hypothetical protein